MVAAALEMIVKGDEAWSRWDDVEAAHPGELAGLEREGLVARWERPDYLAVTLTPLAAYRMGLAIHETMRVETVNTGALQDPPVYHRERVAIEVPVWRPANAPERCPRTWRRAGEVPLPRPELIEAPRPKHEPARDATTGEVLVLFGRTVWVDHRLIRRQPNALDEAKAAGLIVREPTPAQKRRAGRKVKEAALKALRAQQEARGRAG